jgi:predicted ABC-type ATPase
MPNIYVIAGCNGAGKTTCAFSILPDILATNEFVNADLIAKGISPFNESTVSFEAGRIMLTRIKELMVLKKDFVFETTLSTISYVKLLQEAKNHGYSIHLLYFWLKSYDLAIKRVKRRVEKGGHNIPEDVIIRRYDKSLVNLNKHFLPLVDAAIIFDNSNESPEVIAEKENNKYKIEKEILWQQILQHTKK